MRVVGVTPDAYGGPEALRLFELPERHAEPGTVRIAVHAAAVNPTDTVVRSGLYPERQAGAALPYVPGMDVAGVVDEIGPDTDTDLRVGDRVMAIVMPKGSHGGYSDSIVLSARSVVRIPTGTTLVEACTVPMNGLTARLALDLLAVPPGGTIAVTGAAGTLGGYAMQLAKADGLRVIADSSERDEPVVRAAGADVVVQRGDDVADRIREVAPEGVDAVVDAALLRTLILPAVRDGGGLAAVRPFGGDTERGITIHQVWVREYRSEREKLDRLRELVEEGALTLRVADVVPPDRASEAHAQLERGGTRGRLVIQFRDERAESRSSTARSISALRTRELAALGPKVRAVAPSLPDYAASFAYGEIWERPGLEKRDRSIATIAALVASSCTEELRLHVLRGMANGITKDELAGIFTQLIPYVGFPLVVSAAASVADLVDGVVTEE